MVDEGGSHEPHEESLLLGRIWRELRQRGLDFDVRGDQLVVGRVSMLIPLTDDAIDVMLARVDMFQTDDSGYNRDRKRESARRHLRGGLPGQEFDLSGRHISEKSG